MYSIPWCADADPVAGGIAMSADVVAWCAAAEPVVGGVAMSVVGVDEEEIGVDAKVGARISGSRRALSVELPASLVAITFAVGC